MAVFSHSRLASYETCPLQYRLRYVDKVDVERRETVEAFVGRRVHESLQYLHDRLMEGVLLSQEEVLAHLQNSWEREWHGGVLIVRAEMTQRDYWNFGVGLKEGDVKDDKEGMNTMRILGENMGWLLQKIHS